MDALIIFGVLYQEYLHPRTFSFSNVFSNVFSTTVAPLRPEAINAVSLILIHVANKYLFGLSVD